MKRTDIIVGKSYTDGKGNVRQVLRKERTLAYNDEDTVFYRITEKTSGPYLLGTEHRCTLASLAIWAKREYTLGEILGDRNAIVAPPDVRLDLTHLDQVEHRIAPPMAIAITIPTSVDGVTVYVAATSFPTSKPPTAADVQRVARALRSV